MMNNIKVLFFFVVTFSNSFGQQKIDVTILYESLCPDSISFFRDQLRPNYEYFKNFININLIPFGKSQSFKNGGEFICQHGPAECELNRIQSCMLQNADNKDQQVYFAICQMSGRAEKTGKACAKRVGIPQNIDTCMDTESGTVLQLDAEQITSSFAPKFIPTIFTM
uniref:Gamma-interferon-inducible lysosomal thiol reductase n=1 Tax=Megaselia scalaris TaxID=36166 RepID=T1H4F7_MEGSC